MPWLSILFGAVVGLSLGLTGVGGAMFAVPLLVYGLNVPPQEAVGISLASVGATALLGSIQHWYYSDIDFGTAFVYAVFGMAGAPLGAWAAKQAPENVLMLAFAGLMLVVAVRMWLLAARPGSTPPPAMLPQGGDLTAPVADSVLPVGDAPALAVAADAPPSAARNVATLSVLGLITGILAGLFGVGGGFIIVPALVTFRAMPIRRAIGTSLLVVALISVAGVSSHLWEGRSLSPEITALFVLGGVVGLFASHPIARRLDGRALQRAFAVVIVFVAAFVMVQKLGFARY